MKWDPFFIDGISIDERGQLDKTSASFLGFRNVLHPSELPKITLFQMLLPKVYLLDHLIPAINTELREREYDTLQPGEWDCWIGMWFLMQLHPGYQMKDFSVKQQNMICHPPSIGGVMSGKRFGRILQYLRV